MGRWIDLTGQRFGKLTAYSYSHVELSTGRKMAAWLCVCDCGNKKIIQAHHLRGGKSRSCGCSLFGDLPVYPDVGLVSHESHLHPPFPASRSLALRPQARPRP